VDNRDEWWHHLPRERGILDDRCSSGPRGAFGKFSGLRPGLGSAWRVHNPANVYQLAGYAPTEGVITTGFFMDVTEGTPGSAYHICLGTTAPTADVVVTATRVGTDIEVFPSTRTFTTANWMLPQAVTVAAVNDGVIEGTHTDSVSHDVSSADPFYDLGLLITMPVGVIDNDENEANEELYAVGHQRDAHGRSRERQSALMGRIHLRLRTAS
jgi:hypothetical protein